MSDSSSLNSHKPDQRWLAEFTFHGQPGVIAKDTFEELAAQLIATAAHAWRHCELDSSVTELGTLILAQARQVAQEQGSWTTENAGLPPWADVTVTCTPTMDRPPTPRTVGVKAVPAEGYVLQIEGAGSDHPFITEDEATGSLEDAVNTHVREVLDIAEDVPLTLRIEIPPPGTSYPGAFVPPEVFTAHYPKAG